MEIEGIEINPKVCNGKPVIAGKRDSIPESFGGLEEAADFWDNHSTADYDDLSREVHFDVDLQRRTFLVPIEGNLAKEITTEARREGLELETLVNVWLREKISGLAAK